MAYRLRYQVQVDWVADGAGPMEGSSGGPTLAFSNTVPVPFVPGGNSPTLANFNTALTGSSSTPAAASLALDIATQINAQLARIQGWSTGATQ